MTKNKELNSGEVEQQVNAGSQEHEIRARKVQELRALGLEPWPAVKATNATCKQVIEEYKDEQAAGQESRHYQVSGRVLALREHGKTVFAHIQDRTGRLQIYIKSADIGEQKFEQFMRFIDVGDIIWVSGKSFKTRVGEITLKADAFALQSKCLYPLPEKFHGLTDIETKYRQRYLDLISNQESKERFEKRSLIIKTMRRFLDSHDFVEVETPMLHPIPGGAAARPFVTHHNTLNTDLYLRVAPELYLKRLVVGGLDRVYEINRNFRNEGVSTRHNPEFTMVEFYAAYLDYHYIMSFVESMLKELAFAANGTETVVYGDYILDFSKPFERLTMAGAIIKYMGCTEQEVSPAGIDGLFKKHNLAAQKGHDSWGYKLYLLFETFVEKQLIQPTFITEFPVEVSPLAKRSFTNPAVVDRFELFMAGMELSNGFNELNDPYDQAERFKEQAQDHETGNVEAHRYDADYVHALEYALPPTVGVGIGIDRLTMLLTNTTSIKDVILFPTLKRKE
jgi:lysyl-tRNA synthetase class 2